MFVFNISDLHFSHVPTLQTDTSHRQAVITLKIHNSGFDRLGVTLFDHSSPFFGFRPILWEALG